MAMSAANHVNVSHAPLLLRHSFQDTTPMMSSAARPTNAAATLLMPTADAAPRIHKLTVTRNAPVSMHTQVSAHSRCRSQTRSAGCAAMHACSAAQVQVARARCQQEARMGLAQGRT
jgi:hypothetical protein